MIYVEVPIETSVHYKRMSHCYALRLHRMLFRIDKLSEILVVEVRHFAFAVKLHKLILYSFAL